MDDLENSLCPIKDDCPFYRKEFYNTKYEIQFYTDHCLKYGVGCGMKYHYDVSERLKRLQNGNISL